MSRSLVLRPVPVTSVVHGVRPEVKVVALGVTTTALALRPGWWALLVGWVAVTATARAARIPRTALAPPPRWVLAPLAAATALAALAGGPPTVAGIGLGGVLDALRLLAFGTLLLAAAAVLAWTTSLADLGDGLTRLVRPLRVLRLPVDELATVLALAVRCVPLVAAELQLVLDARRSRPSARGGDGTARPTRRLRVADDAVDVGVAVVVGSFRRASELAAAMAARGSTQAPPTPPPPWRIRDLVALGAAALVAGTMLLAG